MRYFNQVLIPPFILQTNLEHLGRIFSSIAGQCEQEMPTNITSQPAQRELAHGDVIAAQITLQAGFWHYGEYGSKQTLTYSVP